MLPPFLEEVDLCQTMRAHYLVCVCSASTAFLAGGVSARTRVARFHLYCLSALPFPSDLRGGRCLLGGRLECCTGLLSLICAGMMLPVPYLPSRLPVSILSCLAQRRELAWRMPTLQNLHSVFCLPAVALQTPHAARELLPEKTFSCLPSCLLKGDSLSPARKPGRKEEPALFCGRAVALCKRFGRHLLGVERRVRDLSMKSFPHPLPAYHLLPCCFSASCAWLWDYPTFYVVWTLSLLSHAYLG